MQNRSKRSKALIFIVGLLIFLYWKNNHIIITNITYTNSMIPTELGNSIFPIRIFNRPEVIKVTLKSE